MFSFRKFKLALSYVSAIPLGQEELPDQKELSGLGFYLPVVGLLFGLLLAALQLVFRFLSAAELIASFFLLLAWLALSGGIHIDGLMDSCDGLFSRQAPERMLEIMRDSRVGNFGALAGFLLLLAKFVGLLSLPDSLALPALMLIPLLARLSEVYVICSFPYARKEGMGKLWHDSSSGKDLLDAAVFSLIVVVLVCLFFQTATPALLIPMAAVPGLFFAFLAQKALGGQTGDTYGAVVEIAEAGALLLLSLFAPLLGF